MFEITLIAVAAILYLEGILLVVFSADIANDKLCWWEAAGWPVLVIMSVVIELIWMVRGPDA